MKYLNSVAILAAALLAGCGGLSTRELAGRSILSGEANVRHVYFVQPDDRGEICVEPMPDTALARSIGVNLTGSGGRLGDGASAEAQLEYETAVVQLAGRTQSVVLARDLLFRACIDRANGFLTNDQVFVIYGQTIGLIRDLGAADRNATAAQAAAEGVAPSSIAALGYDLTREVLVTRVATALITKTTDERTAILNRALACGSTDAICRSGQEAIRTASDLTAMTIALGRLRSDEVTRIADALD